MVLKRFLVVWMAMLLLLMGVTGSWAAEQPVTEKPSGGATAAAVVSNLFFMPGKTTVCVLSSGVWTVVMLVSAGTYYNEAGEIVKNSCAGKWLITGEDIANPPAK
jgi:hypothetical protein